MIKGCTKCGGGRNAGAMWKGEGEYAKTHSHRVLEVEQEVFA